MFDPIHNLSIHAFIQVLCVLHIYRFIVCNTRFPSSDMWFHCFIVNNTHFTSWNLLFHWFIVNNTHFTSWNLVFHWFIVNSTHSTSWNLEFHQFIVCSTSIPSWDLVFHRFHFFPFIYFSSGINRGWLLLLWSVVISSVPCWLYNFHF